MNTTTITIRTATPADAPALLAIYAPYITDTAVSFEYDVPSVEEFADRIRGTLKKYPYMVDISTGEIPEGEQRPILKDFLLLNGVDIEPWEEKTTHWCVRQAIKLVQE